MSEHVCRESENPRARGYCACGKKLDMEELTRNDYMEKITKEAMESLHDPGPLFRGNMRKFESGATRDGDEGKLDYEGFLSPLVVREFANYMHKHRFGPDGSIRESDNWQKGIPQEEYMKSMFRHFMEVWHYHRNRDDQDSEYGNIVDSLCAMMFNVMGMMYEELKPADENPGMGYE